jgi:hypothetical protein
MKPKTALQKQIVELSSKLPVINDKQKQYAIDKSFENWAVISRNTMFCLECSNSWKEGKGIDSTLSDDKRKCPSCSKTLKLFKYNKQIFKEIEYFGILTTIEGYQVVRMLSATKFMKKSEKPTYLISEVMQHFIDEKGVMTTMSKKTQMFSQAYDQWVFHSDLEVREDYIREEKRANLNPWKIYPERKILPIIKRNGFKGQFHGIAPQNLFKGILTNSNAECLLKSNQTSALEYYLSNPYYRKYLPSVKICTRNSYAIKHFKLWVDYVDLLIHFGKDLQNPKYVCPSNLSLAHDKLVAKKRAIQRKDKYKNLKQEIEEAQIVYNEQKKEFFGLKFTDKKITVSVIERVSEFMEEGDELGHCVFTNEYHKKPNSLVFSASIGNKRLETVEVLLSENKIEQSRGKGNKATKYNQKIIDLVNRNLHKISAIAKHAS